MNKSTRRPQQKRYRTPAAGSRKRRNRRRKSRILPVLGTVAFVIVILGALAGYFLYRRYSYGMERADLNAYFNVQDASSYPVFFEGQETEAVAKKINGVCYLSLADVHTYISDRFYYGEADRVLIYTLPDAVNVVPVAGDASNPAADEGGGGYGYDVARLEGDTLYVALDYIKQFFNVTYTVYDDPNHLQLVTDIWQMETVLIGKDTHLRLRGGVKSEILKDLEKGDRVVIVDDSLGDWIKVRTMDDYTGYVENKFLGEKEPYSVGTNEIPEPVFAGNTRPHRINLGWHQIGGVGGNDTLEEVIAQAKGLNVISPTWIGLSDNAGAISSFGTPDYVQTAHQRGLEVWALVSDFANEGIAVEEVLARTATRATLIDNLINEARRLSLDGLNIDFEKVPAEAGDDFIQFIRELSIACRANSLVLSVDNYVPYGFNDYYNRREQGVFADYVIIMGYDEHYAGSAEAGSVASIEYVRYGIEATCAQVPAEKVINAVPFYTRVWTTSQSGVSSYATGMDAARQAAQEYGMTFTWDDTTAQYYAQTTTAQGNRVEIWLEDSESIEAKIAVMRTNGIAGIACWRLGLESPDVWDVIAAYVAR